MHLPELIKDLAFLLLIAALVSILFRKLKQPVVLGYILAGFLLGPHIRFFPNLTEVSSIKVWAEIGVIFLLFSLGLEFSFKKLLSVGRSAILTAFFENLLMLLVGYSLGKAMGWSTIDSIFLGGMISISSTSIIYRAFDELGYKAKRFVHIVFGILVVEDLIAILLLVLLSSLAVSQQFSGVELLRSSLKLGFFLIVWFLSGIFLIPLFLQRIRKYLNEESLLLVAMGLCFMMVVIATQAGFSPALGAFVMGSILSETRESHKIEIVLKPVLALFSAVFFVSVGMLFDPYVFAQYWWQTLCIILAILIFKSLGVSIGAIIAGENSKVAVQSAMSLTQIGEFSFIIATLGINLGVTGSHLYPIAVAVSIITSFLTPYMIRSAVPFHQFLESRMPQKLKLTLASYQEVANQKSSNHIFILLIKAYALRLIVNLVLILSIALAIEFYAYPELVNYFGPSSWLRLGTAVLCILVSLPFWWGFLASESDMDPSLSAEEQQKIEGMKLAVYVVRAILTLFLFLLVITRFVSLQTAAGFAVLCIVLSYLLLKPFAKPIYAKLQKKFYSNLDDKRLAMRENQKSKYALAPWDSQLIELQVSQYSDWVGKNLMQLQLKEKYALAIAVIERGHKQLLAPAATEIIFPGDKLHLLGSEEQLDLVRPIIEKQENMSEQSDLNFVLASYALGEESKYIAKSIKDSGIREELSTLIVGIERNDKKYLNPESNFVLQAGDLLWVVGDMEKCKERLC